MYRIILLLAARATIKAQPCCELKDDCPQGLKHEGDLKEL